MHSSDQIYYRLESMPALNWGDLVEAGDASREVLEEVASDRKWLRELVRKATESAELRQMAEHFERIDRLVLYDDLKRGIRIRLHVYPTDHFDGPHNHRWSFSSRVLRGGYRHWLFPTDIAIEDTTEILELKPAFARWDDAGSAYTLHHSFVHSVVAKPGTISVILRGPAEKERLLMTDLKTGRMRWKYGVERESENELNQRNLSAERYEQLCRQLVDQGLV